jgi:hypothetical protein
MNHSDDGDFVYPGRAAPYTVIEPSKNAGRIIFSTKTLLVAKTIDEFNDFAGLGLIGRYGLPSRADLSWIRKIVSNHELFFLGDMDPVDLMIFCWLRACLRPKLIVHLGINDSYLTDLQTCLPDSFIMKSSFSERQSLPVLKKAFPDLHDTLGVECAKILEQGRKIELDAIVSASHTNTSILPSTVRG